MLHEMLVRLSQEYSFESSKSFTNSEFGNFVRKDIAQEAKRQLIFKPQDLKVKTSVGNGQWASVPWLAFFDPLITDSATKGFYVVYLVNPRTEEIFLSMNQGTTEVFEEFGKRAGQRVLKRRASDIVDRIPEFSKLFSTEPINLSSKKDLPQGYMAGHAFGRRYTSDELDPDQFTRDLETMLAAYKELVFRGGTTPSDVMANLSGSSDIKEIRKYVFSQRVERTPGVRKKVLESKEAKCEACNLDPELHYGYRGKLENTLLDVHHCKPISELAEGEERRYKVPDDFLVLCPTCHRQIHKLDDPSNLEALKKSIKFKHAIEIKNRIF